MIEFYHATKEGIWIREFDSLPKIAGYADDPETLYDKVVADALSED